jgi:hypothetical protein
MAELTVDDVEQYTDGRLGPDNADSDRLLAAALAAARRYCGWHVTPQQAETVTIDGPGSRLLVLPTLHLATLTSITEDGESVEVSSVSSSERGLVRKKSCACWTRQLGGVVVAMTHGFAAAEDWQAAVLSVVDRASYAATGGRPTAVGPFQWGAEAMTNSAFSVTERAVLDQYRLELPA